MESGKSYVRQENKKSGIVYIYENNHYWSKEKQQTRSKRKCVGKIAVIHGIETIVPTGTRGRKRKEIAESTMHHPLAKRYFYGATYLFDCIVEKMGIIDDLKCCFPDTYKQILSVAYYLILEDNNPMFRFEKWSYSHKHPFERDITSQRSSELFASISDSSRSKFFKLQGNRRKENEYWLYDITTISSYSETLIQVQYGYNKENDKLPQLNLALVFGEESRLPFYYKTLAGNIPDSKTVETILADLTDLGFDKVKLVMDRGFYSEANIVSLYKARRKFLIATKTSLVYVREKINIAFEQIHSVNNYNHDYGLYGHTLQTEWYYKKRDGTNTQKRMYVHIYYNVERAAEDESRLLARLDGLRKEILSKKRVDKHDKLYTTYFDVKETDEIIVSVKDEVFKNEKRYFGYFALMSKEPLKTWEALDLYRNKDLVEKAFGNIKERLNMRRALVSSEKSLEGKLFVQFIALIIISYINSQMKANNLYRDFTLQGLLDKLDIIACIPAL
jgi:transposase